MIKPSRSGKVDYAISVLLTLPFAIGLPILFYRLYDQAVFASGAVGGMWFPNAGRAADIYMLGWMFLGLPFFLAMVIGLFSLGFLVHGWTLVFPSSNFAIDLSYPSPVFLGTMVVSAIVQVFAWSPVTHWIRIMLRYARRNKAVLTEQTAQEGEENN